MGVIKVIRVISYIIRLSIPIIVRCICSNYKIYCIYIRYIKYIYDNIGNCTCHLSCQYITNTYVKTKVEKPPLYNC